MKITYFAPAKVNLWLHVFPPDRSGFHPLDTLFCALDLADEITVEETGRGIRLDTTGADVGPAVRNLAFRAANEYCEASGLPQRAHIRLHKRIPAGAGLGGGSSDAAAVLQALNELHGGILSAQDLLTAGARLGSDVPFFLCGSVLAHATGRGEVLRPLSPLPSAPALIVVPDFAIATSDAYRWLDEANAHSAAPAAEPNVPRGWSDVVQSACNAFEPVLFRRFPRLRELSDSLRASGARIALLSGSGSALFAIYSDVQARDQAAYVLRRNTQAAAVIPTFTHD